MYYRKFNPYGQLRTVMLGCYFPEDYFDCVLDTDIRNSLKKIAKEIREDLDFYQQVLESHDVKVIRPSIPTKQCFVDAWRQDGKFLSPPLQPRNFHSVIGHNIYQLTTAEEAAYINAVLPGEIVDLSESNYQLFAKGCQENQDCHDPITDTWYCRQKYQDLAGPDWPRFRDYVKGSRSSIPAIQQELALFQETLCYETKEFTPLLAPNLFPVDGRLYVDCKEYFDYGSWAKLNIDFAGDIITLNTKAGHTDGFFVVLGHNVIIGIEPGIDYDKFFPGYRVVRASDSYQETMIKRKIVGSPMLKKWWVPGEENNTKLTNHVDTYMQNFVGTAYETSFDLNVLAINQDTICMVMCDSMVTESLNDYGIEAIEIPWRHRFFVDCGIHCITLDLYREDR